MEYAQQLLRCPDTLVQLCDIGAREIARCEFELIRYKSSGMCFGRVAKHAATIGRSISMEVWAAGMWAMSQVQNPALRQKVLLAVVTDIRANIISNFPPAVYFIRPGHESEQLLQLAFIVCPKGSPVRAHVLYRIRNYLKYYRSLPQNNIQRKYSSGLELLLHDEIIIEVVKNLNAPATLRAAAILDASRRESYYLASYAEWVVLMEWVIELDPRRRDEVYVKFVDWVFFGKIPQITRVQIGSRSLNVWGMLLELWSRPRYPHLMLELWAKTFYPNYIRWIKSHLADRRRMPVLQGEAISLGDSSMSIFEYMHAFESPSGSIFRPALIMEMLPADSPWSCRRHAVLDRHTSANALFATFLCALARLEGPGGPLRPSHHTMWEYALESWTLGDSARMYKAPPSYAY